jgi:hypothetical protein
MGYSDDSRMIRVDFFQPSGKWYCTEAVKWVGEYHAPSLVHEEFALALQTHLKATSIAYPPGQMRLQDMVAVCLKPYHEYQMPLMMQVSEIHDLVLRLQARLEKKAKDGQAT